MSGDALRTSRWTGYSGLPPVGRLALSSADPTSWRFVRQDSGLWGALHWGVLTSRNMPAFLGLLEPAPAKALGTPRHMADHRRMVEAVAELREAADWRARAYSQADGAAASGAGQVIAMADHSFEQSGVPDHAVEAEGGGAEQLLAVNAAACREYAAVAAKAPPAPEHCPAWRGMAVGPLRCSWGSAQEGTALAAYLGYLDSSPAGRVDGRRAMLREIGCGPKIPS